MRSYSKSLSAAKLWFSAFLATLLLCGCQLPNVNSFADATGELRTAIVEGGAVTAGAMARTDDDDAKEFAEIWQVRLKLMDVLVAYSDALAGIAMAGKSAAETSQALGDSLARLGDMAPSGSGAAVTEGVNLAALLVKTGIEIKGYRDLAKATKGAHEALSVVAQYLEADLRDLERLYVKASQDIESDLDSKYGQREFDRAALLSMRDAGRAGLLGSFNDNNFERVRKIEELLALMAPEHQQYVQASEGLRQRRVSTLQMFGKARQGVRAWLAAHADLQDAIKQKRRPNVRLIVSTAQEIRAAVERIRDLDSTTP